ncbi:MAG: hypothetical protein K9I94_14510 [Bacteroidales bacterium]|nr:hypothetical protein [Bacteroidales bacterium]
MKKLIYALVVIVLTGCSGKPGSRQVEKQIENYLIGNGLEKLYEVENVKKVNGILENDNTYIAIVKYELIFKMNLEEYGKTLDDNDVMGSFNDFGNLLSIIISYGEVKEGDKIERKDEFTFIKTDNGWRLME